MHYKKMFHEILKSQNYLCLATVSTDNIPWSSPVAYVCDNDFFLYFVSSIDSLHSRNIASNNRIALSIYDSRQSLRDALWIQAWWKAEKIDENNVATDIRQELFDKVLLSVLSKDYAIYRITMDEVYLPDSKRWKEFHELRLQININE